MKTFLEYSYNLEQVSNIFDKMAKDKIASPESQMSFILMSIPVDFMDKLPDGARANAALIFNRILSNNMEMWDELGRYVRPLWDQPISGPAKTLGKSLLNKLSAEVMQSTGSEFFISYSGELSKGVVYKYTKRNIRTFINRKNYGWKPYKDIIRLIKGDYAEHFNNYRNF